jgi:hypothetical protein
MPYPTTAYALVENSDALSHDAFALIARVEETSNGLFIEIAPDAPIAAMNKKVQQQVQQESGVILPLRSDIIQGKHSLPANHYLLGAGALMELQHGNQTVMPLLQRDAHAPSNPNKWTNASGMCDVPPAQTAIKELLEESGIIRLSSDNSALTLYVPVPVEALNNTSHMATAIQVKQVQEATIRSQLPEEVRDLPITLRPLPLKTLPLPDSTPLTYLKLPHHDTFQPTSMMMTRDEDIQGITLMARYSGQLPPDGSYYTVDPEGFGRHTSLVNKEQLQGLECTTALQDAKERGVCFSDIIPSIVRFVVQARDAAMKAKSVAYVR